MSQQIPLRIDPVKQLGREDFIATDCNQDAFDLAISDARWIKPWVVVVGSKASGKTHLAEIAQQTLNALAIDDIDLELTTREQELDLFHRLNASAENGERFFLTSHKHPNAWGLTVPDLLSRLLASNIVEIKAPDDLLTHGLIAKGFADRQLQVDAAVIDYVLKRIPRDYQRLNDIVEALDKAALAQGRRVTVVLARKIVAENEG